MKKKRILMSVLGVAACGISVGGVYAPPEGYFCAEREKEAFEAFDAAFPPKKKQKLPGQLF